jgi:hypothetical protein
LGEDRAVECIADGLGNSTLLKIDLHTVPWEMTVLPLWRKLSARNTTLQKLTLDSNSITSTGVEVSFNDGTE